MPKSRSKKELDITGSLLGPIEQIAPPWMARALDPSNPSTPQGESVKTASTNVGGREILFPTIRMRDGGRLERLSVGDAEREAIARQDFIVFENPKQATAFSKELSAELGRRGRRK